MNAGSIVGVGTIIGLGLISYGLIKRKCKKEVKVYNEIKYPDEKDRGNGDTDARVGTTEPEPNERIAEDRCSGKHEKRGTLQDKSSKHNEQFDRGNEESDKTSEPDSDTIESVEQIEIRPVEPIEE